MTTLAGKAILSGADNHPPILEKDMYDSWKSRMELYMMNRQHGRMILESVENGPLIWPSIEENGVTRPKKYSELSATEERECKLYDEFGKFNYKKGETLLILQGLPLEVYALVSNHKVTKELWERIQLVMQGTSLTKQEREFCNHQMTQVFLSNSSHSNQKLRNSPQVSPYQSPQHGSPYQSQQYSNNQSSTPLSITYPSNDYQSSVHHNVYSPPSSIPQLEYALTINQQSEFPQLESGLIVLGRQISFATRTTRTYTPGASGSNSRKQRTVICYNCKGEGHMSEQCTKYKRKRDDSWFKDKVLLVQAQANGQILHEEELAFLADPGIEKVALMANLSHYGSDALGEVNNHDNMDNNMINQAVQAMPSSEQSSVVNHLETEITSDRNIIPYSQYVKESQQAANSMNSLDPSLSSRPTKVEVPKELPKVSMVNMSLKKLKHHRAGFDVVIKERTTATTITKGSWGTSIGITSFQRMNLKRKLKGKALVDNAVMKYTIDPAMLKTDVEPITPKLLNKITAHYAYIKHTQKEATVLRDLVEQDKSKFPLDHSLESTYRKPRKSKTNVPVRKSKVLKSASANKKEPIPVNLWDPKFFRSSISSLINAGRQIVLMVFGLRCSNHMTWKIVFPFLTIYVEVKA
ncbi:integrase, catalytic region, zinc finger, CCHC-type containing protein [Tanacetum coccineum]